MICPYCAEDIPAGSKSHPGCKISDKFPTSYLKFHAGEYDAEPLIVSVVGSSQHGKTVFLCALFDFLEKRLPNIWPSFYYRALDQESLSKLNQNRRKLDNYELPERTKMNFPRPGIFRLSNIPRMMGINSLPPEDTTVLIYDPPGEAYDTDEGITKFASFVKRSSCVLFLIDLAMLADSIPSKMAELLETYLLGIENMSIDKDSQHLIVVYTKADKLQTSVPAFKAFLNKEPTLKDYISQQQPPTLTNPEAHFEHLKKISQLLEEFTRTHLNAVRFMHVAEDWFKSVSYTAVSSLGSDPEKEGEDEIRLTSEMSPRGVADPLLYVLAKSTRVKKEPPSPRTWWQGLLEAVGLSVLIKKEELSREEQKRKKIIISSAALITPLVLTITIYFWGFYNADFRRGYDCELRKDYPCAIDNYTKAIEASPKYAEAYNGRGWAHLEQGSYDNAYKDCSKANQLQPDFAEALTCQGMASAFNNSYDEALKDCAKAIELKPEYAAAYFCRGIASWYKKQYAAAIKDYNKAIELEPTYARAYFYRGSAHSDSGNPAQSRTDYQRAAELEPELTNTYYYRDHALAYNHRGLASLKQKNYKDAIEDFNKAVYFKREYAEAYENLGTAYTAVGNYEEGIKNFTEAIRLQPQKVALYISRGDAYFRQGTFGEAVKDYTRALDLNPDTPEVYVKRAAAYLSDNKCVEAINDYKMAIGFRPNYFDAYFGLGNAHLKKGDEYVKSGDRKVGYGYYHEAVQNYDMAAKLRPEYVRALYNKGIAEARREGWGIAVEIYEKAIELDSDLASEQNASYSYAFWRRGLDFRSKGQAPYADREYYYSLAAKDFQEAIRLNPNNTAAKDSLASLEE